MRARIYADFNGGMASPRDPSRWMVPLDTWGSLRDLSNAGVALREGLPLVIHADSDEDEDLEADAVACFDHDRGYWYAELEGEIRYVPAYERSVTRFLCLGCRADLGAEARVRAGAGGGRCPRCGHLIRAAIAAPDGGS